MCRTAVLLCDLLEYLSVLSGVYGLVFLSAYYELLGVLLRRLQVSVLFGESEGGGVRRAR